MQRKDGIRGLIGFFYCPGKLFNLLCFCLGLTALSQGRGADILLLAACVGLVFFRVRFGKPMAFLPDALLCAFPYFWAMNATHGFALWREWWIWLFFAAFVCALLEVVRVGKAFPLFAEPRLAQGAAIACITFLGFASGVRLTFPIFPLETFRELFFQTLFFFGGLIIAQPAVLLEEGAPNRKESDEETSP
ncbi:MAG: hypothetical protein WA705_22880 [Candidatus Ozemobacteraceae bacterium]